MWGHLAISRVFFFIFFFFFIKKITRIYGQVGIFKIVSGGLWANPHFCAITLLHWLEPSPKSAPLLFEA